MTPFSLAVIVLLTIILTVAPLILGAARLWIQMPLLGGVALLMLILGAKLIGKASPGIVRRVDLIDLSVVAFVGYAVVRWLTSPTEYFSRIEILDIVAYATIFFACRYALPQRKLGLVLIYIVVTLGVFETCFGYYLSNHLDWFPFGETEKLHLHYAPRWTGTYGCPNHYSALLVMAVSGALALACFSKLPWPARIVLFYLAGMTMIGVMYSVSRGSYLGLMAAVGALTIFGLRHGSVRWWVPTAGAVVLIFAAGAAFSLSSHVRERTMEAVSMVQKGNYEVYCRYELAKDALRISADHPFFGTGPATFVFIHPQYQSATFDRKAVLTHDDYLNCLADYGFVGFGLAMIFVVAVTFKFFQTLRGDVRWQDRVVIAAGFAAWSALLIHSVVDFNMHIPANAFWLFALTGLGLGRLKTDSVGAHWSIVPLAPLGRGLGWAVVVLSFCFAFMVARTGIGAVLYDRAYADAIIIPINQSIEQVDASLSFDRGNVSSWVLLGDLHRYRASRNDTFEEQVAEGQKALDAYQRAIRLNPLDDTIRARMGMTYDLMRRYSEAFFCYQAAVKAQPYNGQFWSWLGNHYWSRGMTDKAQEAYAKAQACPHGFEGSQDALKELQTLPGLEALPEQSSVVATPEDILRPPDVVPGQEEAVSTPVAPEPPPTDEQIKAAQDHPPTAP